MQEARWFETKSELPKLNEPVLLIYNGSVYNSVFYLQLYDSIIGMTWSFVDDDDALIPLYDASHWMYLKDIPIPSVV